MTDPRRKAIVDYALSQVGAGDEPAYWVSSGLPADTHADWCGAFVLACFHAASVALDVKWRLGIGFIYSEHLPQTKDPQPGDVGYYDKPYQHHDLVVSLENGILTTVDANAPGVKKSVRPVPSGAVFYSIDKFLGAQPPSPTPQPSPTPSPLLRGIDVSHHNPPASIDYAALAKDHRFLIARAAYGTTVDETCSEHVKRARDAGMATGLYTFFRASQPVSDQLDTLLSVSSNVGCGPGWLPPAIDLEENTADGPVTTDRYAPAEQLAACVREQFGACMVYVAVGFWAEIGHPEWVKQHLLWTAHWGVQYPTTPGGMPFAVWQNHVGVIPGVSPGQLDQDVAPSLPLLKPHDPAAPLLLTIDWDELRADRDAVVQEEA